MIDYDSEPGSWLEATPYLTAPTSAAIIAMERRLDARRVLRPLRSRASSKGWETRRKA